MRLLLIGLAAALVLAGPLHAGTLEAHLTSAGGAPIEDAAVVLEPASGSMPKRRSSATISQRNREFVPYFTIVQTGTAIEFPNQDPFKHHVYSFSPAKKFEIKLYAGKPERPIVFDKPGEVAIGCNIHDWMEAYVLVVDSPYFGKTDRSGQALLANVPAGRYRLKLWHPRQASAPAARDIVIGAARTKVDLQMEVRPRLVKPRPAADPGY